MSSRKLVNHRPTLQQSRRMRMHILRTDLWMAQGGETGHYVNVFNDVVGMLLHPWIYAWGWAEYFDLYQLERG